jgi:uncharacterized protein
MLNIQNIRCLREVFSGFNQIKAAYLFGSYVENKETKYSDIDIGLVLNDDYDSMIKLDILMKLTENNFDNIDLVILNRANPLVKFEAVKHNKLIYQQEEFNAAGYYSLVIRTFLDFRPYLEVQRHYLKERILNG